MTPMQCPNGCDLTGPPIPEDHRELYYGGETHFSRVIGNYDWYEDRTVSWTCPDCETTWTRLPPQEEEREPKFIQSLVTLFNRPSPFTKE